MACLRNGQLGEARAKCAAVLSKVDDHAGLHHLMAAICHDQRETATAVVHARKAVSLRPNGVGYQRSLATCLLANREPDEAGAVVRRALEQEPDNAVLLILLGDCMFEQGCYREALAVLRRAIALDPDHVQGHMVMGSILAALGRAGEAGASFVKGLTLRPDNPLGQVNRGLALMRAGDFVRGLEAYEARWSWKCFRTRKPAVSAPRWQGEDLPGGRILLWSEQGIGDTIQYARYAALVRERCDHVTLAVTRRAHRLLSSVPGVVSVIEPADDAGQRDFFDAWVPTMSLPWLFGTTVETIPSQTPYLRAPEPANALIRERLYVSGLKVGFCWCGNPSHRHDRHRSMAFDQLAPLVGHPGITAFRLQRDVRERDHEALALLAEIEPEGGDLADVASAIAGLDLVVTVDTSIAHLAGALNVPCWLMLPYVSDFRWLEGRADPPWYPSVRLFRQPQPADWQAVVDEVRSALDAFV